MANASLARRMTLRVYPNCANQTVDEPMPWLSDGNLFVYTMRFAEEHGRRATMRVQSLMPPIGSANYYEPAWAAILPYIKHGSPTMYFLYGEPLKPSEYGVGR